MWPEPLIEKGIYRYKEMTILLFKGNLYELIAYETPYWQKMGPISDYSLLLEDVADVEYRRLNHKDRPKEMRRVAYKIASDVH